SRTTRFSLINSFDRMETREAPMRHSDHSLLLLLFTLVQVLACWDISLLSRSESSLLSISCDTEESAIALLDAHFSFLLFILILQIVLLIAHFVFKQSHPLDMEVAAIGTTGTTVVYSGIMLISLVILDSTSLCRTPITLPFYFLVISTVINGLICVFYLSRWRKERGVYFINVQHTNNQKNGSFPGYKFNLILNLS
ncbi:hypothetical protein PMAYCL1PPCAC_13507, partial [Pristionchus mayeri]